MPTGAPLICRTCGEAIAEKNGSRYCRNGCQIYTAQPVGVEYMTPMRTDEPKTTVVGGIRRVPTCKD